MATTLPPINAVRGGHIARRGELHACVVAVNNPTTKCYLLMWTSLADQRLVEIPGWQQHDLSSPTLEFVGHDRLMIASAKNSGPMRVTEYTLTEDTLTLQWDWTYGDATCRWGSSTRLDNGGVFIATYRQDEHNNSKPFFYCDVVYRPAPLPTGLAAPTNPYQHQFFAWPMFAGSQMPCSIQVVQHWDGLIHLFWVADSFGQIGRSVFYGLTLTQTNSAWMNSSHGDMAPSGENPRLVVMRDGNDLLLSYQNQPHTYHPNCSAAFGNHDVISSRTAIVRFTDDDSPRLEALLDWPSAHITFPWPCIWPRRDANGLELYFLNEWLNPDNCVPTWRFGLVSGGQIGYGDEGNGKIDAWSDDGWIMFSTQTGQNPHLWKLSFRPLLKIETWSTSAKATTELCVSWDHARPDQQLESSLDLERWSDVPGATVPPVIVPNTGTQQFFRVRQS